jgi:hypothetical protein
LPKEAGSAALQPMPTNGAWLAPLLGNKAQPAVEFTGDAKTSVWLPNERIAKAWGEYVKDGNVSDPTPPAPPRNVRVSPAGELTWEAEADLDSGIAEFVIERDGKMLARIPPKHTGYFVGRPTFQQIGYGDYPTPPLAEMRYTDANAKGGRKHIYAVRTVNTAGSKSEPTMAVEMPGSGTEQLGRVMPPEITSRQWPQGPETIKPRVPIKLEARLLDACVGRYEFAPSAVFPTGATMAVWREGDRLLAQPRSGGQSPGVLDIYPLSETNFFFKIDDSQLTFVKNGKGGVTAVIHRASRRGIPDQLAKKVPDPAK